jgi:hypothetical protein
LHDHRRALRVRLDRNGLGLREIAAIEAIECIGQQAVGGAIGQQQSLTPVLRHGRHQSLEQRVCHIQAPASAENGRRQSDRFERLRHGASTLERAAGRQQGGAAEVRAQSIKIVDETLLERPAAKMALDAEDQRVAARHVV